jgi:hypothetical protein
MTNKLDYRKQPKSDPKLIHISHANVVASCECAAHSGRNDFAEILTK